MTEAAHVVLFGACATGGRGNFSKKESANDTHTHTRHFDRLPAAWRHATNLLPSKASGASSRKKDAHLAKEQMDMGPVKICQGPPISTHGRSVDVSPSRKLHQPARTAVLKHGKNAVKLHQFHAKGGLRKASLQWAPIFQSANAKA